jgi:hypothetical protein
MSETTTTAWRVMLDRGAFAHLPGATDVLRMILAQRRQP